MVMTQQIATDASAKIAKALDSLPTIPVVALQIGEVVHSNKASVAQVAEILRTDPATSAKLLKLVNSPYFGIPGGVSDVARAIPFVGFNTLYQLVLSITVLDALDARAAGFDPKALWLHSLTVATAARELAAELRFNDGGVCFTAGLLHDMGKIALAKIEPEKLAKVFASMRDEGMSMADAEVKHGLPEHDTDRAAPRGAQGRSARQAAAELADDHRDHLRGGSRVDAVQRCVRRRRLPDRRRRSPRVGAVRAQRVHRDADPGARRQDEDAARALEGVPQLARRQVASVSLRSLS
jgi:putative nucleotidyltransferase with HDIG domain